MYFHIWFVTKYRKPSLKGKVERMVKDTFKECIYRHKYNVLKIETNIDHVHILLEASREGELPRIVRTLKAVSAKEVLGYYKQKEEGNGKNSFWARRYGYRKINVSEVQGIRKYIRNQKDTTGRSL